MPRGALAGWLSGFLDGVAVSPSKAGGGRRQVDVLVADSGSLKPHQRGAFFDLFPIITGKEPGPLPDPGRLVLPKRGQWLKFASPAKWLKSSDIIYTDWVGKDAQHCSKNVTHPPARPWWHPDFVFREPVYSVRVRLTDLTPSHLGDAKPEPLWDVVFTGGPGNDVTVPNRAVPRGGHQPLFPEFCPPLGPDAKYELRLTEMDKPEKAWPSRFDERLILVPKVPTRTLVNTPRPPYMFSGNPAGHGEAAGPRHFL